jgi:hypothetical protein
MFSCWHYRVSHCLVLAAQRDLVYCLLQKFIPRGGSEGMWRKCHELADAHLYLNCDYQIIACFPSVAFPEEQKMIKWIVC